MTMLSGVTQNKEIESLNKKLHSNLKKFISGKYERKIIYPQGSRNATVYFSKNLPAVMAPPTGPPMFFISAKSLLIRFA